MKTLKDGWYIVINAYKFTVFEIWEDIFVLSYIAFRAIPTLESTDSMIVSIPEVSQLVISEKVQNIQIQQTEMTLGLKVPMWNNRIPNGLGKGEREREREGERERERQPGSALYTLALYTLTSSLIR